MFVIGFKILTSGTLISFNTNEISKKLGRKATLFYFTVTRN